MFSERSSTSQAPDSFPQVGPRIDRDCAANLGVVTIPSAKLPPRLQQDEIGGPCFNGRHGLYMAHVTMFSSRTMSVVAS